jgi:hypothetical protein
MGATLATRCRECERAYQQARNADPKRKPRRTRAYMATKIEGPCACCGSTADLTRHHLDPIATALGHVGLGDLVPMCRSCNSSIGARRMADMRCPQHGGVVLGG